MALTTIAFCRHCKWRSSENAVQYDVAGAPCPECGSGVSALHCDPEYIGVDIFGNPYVEADVVNVHLNQHKISSVNPVNVTLPRHKTK